MSSSLKNTFDNAIRPDSPYLKLLQERGLVRQELASDELRSEPIRGDAVEQALILFALREREERQAILSQLQEGASTEVEVSAFRGVERNPGIDSSLRLLDEKAAAIWVKAVQPIRDQASAISERIEEAIEAISEKKYDSAQDILSDSTDRQRQVETQFQTAYSEARRALRREYNAEFSSRVWDSDATKHFDTVVNRSIFIPPEEMRTASVELNEAKQQLVSEKKYATELEKRVHSRPERNLGPSMKP